MPSFICSFDTYAQLRKKTKTKACKFGVQKRKVESISYTPDFVHINPDKTGWIMETKGMPNEAFPLRFKLFKQWLEQEGYKVTLFMPTNKEQIFECVEIIKTLTQNSDKE